MADSKISDLTATTTLADTDEVPVASSGASKKITGANLKSQVIASDAELSAIAGLTSAADRLPYFTGSGTAALATFTSAARSVVDDATVAAMCQTLGATRRYSAATLTTPVEVVSSAAETTLHSFTLTGNDLGSTGVLRLVMIGDKLNNNSATDTLRVRVKFGGSTVMDFGGTAIQSTISAVRAPWRWEIVLANLAATNSQWISLFGSIIDQSINQNTGIGGTFNDVIGRRGGGMMLSTAAALSVDTTSDQTLAVTVQLSASSANLAWRIQHAYAEIVP